MGIRKYIIGAALLMAFNARAQMAITLEPATGVAKTAPETADGPPVIADAPVPPETADAVINAARTQAAATHKKVFVIFHASWCGWCHRMDSIMNAPVCKPLFDGQYVITHLVIQESKDKKALENPGAMELYTKYAGGDNQGIPFFLIINTGCPESDEELTYFVRVLHETSTLTADQLNTIRSQFTRKKKA